MAITNARMQIKRGNEVDFDSEKMLVGEWALSTDKRIVRICVAPNVCIRMATYDAFEVDMAKVEKILEECQSIEDAVELINSQVSDKLNATIEYTNQAKQYRDESKAFRDEAEAFAPDGYVELKETVASNTAKIDTIIEKAELNIKNSASGENLHLTDSANGKAVDFGLYGKAEQKQYSGKNLIPYPYYETTLTRNGITFTDNGDGTVTVNGTASATTSFICNHRIDNEMILGAGKYIASGCPKNGSTTTYRLVVARTSATTGGFELIARDYGDGVAFELTEETDVYIGCEIVSGVTVTNLTFKPMVRLASITDDTYEPYTGGIPSPNPDYPQEITVSGSDGSVEVVTENEDSTQSTTATIPTPDGLAGIKVSSGGNYTDENGQQWICDEVVKYADGSGKRIKRIGVIESYNNEEITTGYMSTTGQLTNGAKVIYILSEPIITDLSAEEIAEIEKLHTFYPVTNISNDADCGMSITYMADAKNYIDNRLALIESAMLNNI